MKTDLESYRHFIRTKHDEAARVGFFAHDVPAFLYPFQRHLVSRATELGRSAVFAECGLGKTGIQLAWAEQVVRRTNRPVLVLAPLAVSGQTIREGERFGIGVRYAKDQSCVAGAGIYITNYERLKSFDPSEFDGVVLDESGILKAYSGVTKRNIVAAFARTPYRLACSATPAPNDTQELGNHSEFLSVLDSHEMIARWFLTTFDAGKFRLKGHAIVPFWNWVSSWASMCRVPSDLNPSFSDDGYVLPALNVKPVTVDVDVVAGRSDGLFRDPGLSATKIHAERRITARQRVAEVARLVDAEPNESWVIWTETDYEGDALEAAIPGAGNLRGSLKLEKKEELLAAFGDGQLRVLIAKPKIAGFGLNWQHCARMAFVAATYSFESFYQAVRRCWRFGQTRPVDCYLVSATTEAHVVDTLNRKREEFEKMHVEMMKAARRAAHAESIGADPYAGSKSPRFPAWIGGAA